MDSSSPRYLLTALAALAVLAAALPAAGTSPNGLFQSAARLAGSSKANKSASAKKNARKALTIARRADKRSKDALAAALGPVFSQRITDETITAADLGTDAVESDEIASGAVGSSEIADGSVTAAEIADGSVTAADVAAGAVGSSELADGSVQSSDILDATIGIGDVNQAVWSGSVHQAGTLAARPAASASNNGFLYFATDEGGGTLYRSDGIAWTKAGPGVNQIAQSLTMTSGGTLTDMPSEIAEFENVDYYRKQYDLTNAAQARLVVNCVTAGSESAEIRAQYSVDQSTWVDLDGSSGPSVNVSTTGLKTSSWVNISPAAKADVYLRIISRDGDGVADPVFAAIDIQVR